MTVSPLPSSFFQVADEEFEQLSQLRDTLNTVCAEPSRTGSTGDKPPSRRKQLVGLRNELRAAIANCEKRIEDPDQGPDPEMEQAKAGAIARSARPPHLRGSAILSLTIGDGQSG